MDYTQSNIINCSFDTHQANTYEAAMSNLGHDIIHGDTFLLAPLIGDGRAKFLKGRAFSMCVE